MQVFTDVEEIEKYKTEIQQYIDSFNEKIDAVAESIKNNNTHFSAYKIRTEMTLASFVYTLTVYNCFESECFEKMKREIENFDCENPLPNLETLNSIIESYCPKDNKN